MSALPRERADGSVDGELSTDEGKSLIESVGRLGSMLVLTGGDPMKRPDLWELIEHARARHIPIAVTPAITPLLTRDDVVRFKELGVTAMGVSLDGPDPAVHDGFRQVEGTFERSMQALRWAREVELPVQVNTSVTTDTLPHLKAMYRLLSTEAAPPVKRWSLFLLVPVGRGLELGVPSADEVEELFSWVYEVAEDAPFRVGTTEAPHYRRYWIERKRAEGMSLEEIGRRAGRMAFGVRDGNGVVFVSCRGEIYPAGFLPEPLLGNVKEVALDEVYPNAPALRVRDPEQYKGRCGRCDYKFACGGSRARAFGMQHDMLADDPLCAYQPPA